MADATLGVKVKVDAAGVASDLNAVGANVAKVGDASSRAAGGTDAFSKALGIQNLTLGQLAGALTGVSLGLQLISQVAGGVKSVIEGVISTNIRFGAEMAGVGAVSGASAVQMARLGELARVGGVNVGVGSIEGARGLQELAKGGVSVDAALMGGLRATQLMAKAGGVDLATAAEISAVAMNSFGLSGAQLPHVADLVAGAANASSISVDDFRMSLSQTGAVARTIGFSIDDVSVAIAELGQAGIKGSDAGTSLRTFMLRLSPTTAEATTEMRKLGIITADGTNQFFNAAGRVKNFAAVQEVLKTATAGMTDQQKIATLNTIFGTDAIRAASVMAREGASGFDSLQASMAKVGADDVAKKRLDSLSGDLEKLSAQSEATSVNLGKLFDPFLRSQTKALTDALGTGVVENVMAIMSKGIVAGGKDIIDKTMAGQARSTAGQSLDVSFQAETAANRESLAATLNKVVAVRDVGKELQNASDAGQRLNDVIGHQMSVLGRDNLDLRIQEASVQERLLPLKERQAEIELSILESTDKRTSLQLQGAEIQARMNASASSNALDDADFEERRLRAKIKADALGGQGVSQGDIAALMKLNFSKPQLELAALTEGRAVTLAGRASGAFADKAGMAGLPGQISQAELGLDIARGEREMGRLSAQVDAARQANAPNLAALEGQKRALEDRMFTAAQLKADQEGKGIVLHISQLINTTGEVDYDLVIQNTVKGVYEGFRLAQQTVGMPAPRFSPGSRGTGVTGPF